MKISASRTSLHVWVSGDGRCRRLTMESFIRRAVERFRARQTGAILPRYYPYL